MRRRATHRQRQRDILLAFTLNTVFAVIEGIGGLLTNSLAIVSSALHDAGDSVSLLSGYVSERSSHRLPDERRTFGYRRLALLTAFINANLLFTGSLLIIANAIPRLLRPEAVHPPGMLVLSVIGIFFNTMGVLRLSHGHSVSERVLRWHLLEDVFGWVAVAIVGTTLLFWDVPLLDPLLTILFTAIIVINVWRNLRETANLLLEGVPVSKSVAWAEHLLLSHRGVADVHDIHLWSLDGEQDLFSAHIVPQPRVQGERLTTELKELLARRGIEHAVLELERSGHCAGGAEQRIPSWTQPRVVPSLLLAAKSALRIVNGRS